MVAFFFFSPLDSHHFFCWHFLRNVYQFWFNSGASWHFCVWRALYGVGRVFGLFSIHSFSFQILVQSQNSLTLWLVFGRTHTLSCGSFLDIIIHFLLCFVCFFFLSIVMLLCVIYTRLQVSCLHHGNSTMTDWMRTRIQRESKSNSLCTVKENRFFLFYSAVFLCIFCHHRNGHTNEAHQYNRTIIHKPFVSDKDRHILCVQWFSWFLMATMGGRKETAVCFGFSTTFEIVRLYKEFFFVFHSFLDFGSSVFDFKWN